MDKAKAGQRTIKAADWNQIRDFINNFSLQNGGMVNNPYNPFLVTVKNSVSGVDLEPFQVVRVKDAMYPSRSADDTITAALNGSIELDASAPTGEDGENIAIVQHDIANGDIGSAICSGATLCYVNVANANTDYKYAKSKAGETDYLEANEDGGQARIIWKQPGTGKKLAYVILDQTGTPTPEYFVINYGKTASDTPTHTPTIFKKGSLHYIKYNSAGYWEPSAYNEVGASSTLLKRPPDAPRLVVCQIDAPNSAAECKIPYFTPESNMGVPASFTSSISFFTSNRCGCKPGEHTFTDKMCDYAVVNGGFEYNPQFVANVTVDGQTGGGYDVTADICGEDWLVIFPNANAGLSATNYPDIYPYDIITVLVDCESGVCYALDYPTDYEAGSTQAFYQTPGRGWDSSAVTTPQALADVGLTLFYKVKTNAIL